MEYHTPANSKSPLRASVKIEASHNPRKGKSTFRCNIWLSGQWNWTSAQMEVNKALAIAEKHQLFMLQIDLSRLEPEWGEGPSCPFGCAFAAVLIRFLLIAEKNDCRLQIKLLNKDQAAGLKIYRLDELLAKNLEYVHDTPSSKTFTELSPINPEPSVA